MVFAIHPSHVVELNHINRFAAIKIPILQREARKMASMAWSPQEIEDLYNNAPCGYDSIDKDGFIVRVNETELHWLQYSREELIGRRITDFLTAESQKAFVEHFPSLKSQGSLRDIELGLIRKDGTILPVLLSATAVRDFNGVRMRQV
jgi:PAS domain S-box-containing protein